MARAHFVKSARKDRPEAGIAVGDSYYWWAFMQGGRGGPRRFSKTPPKRSQLTQSEFFARQYDIEDAIEALSEADTLESDRDQIVDDIRELGEEQREKFGNMPDGLQSGPTGELLEGRADACEEWASELEGVYLNGIEKEEGESEDEHEQRVQEAIDELQACGYGGE